MSSTTGYNTQSRILALSAGAACFLCGCQLQLIGADGHALPGAGSGSGASIQTDTNWTVASWSPIDGGGVNGLNFDPTQYGDRKALAMAGSTLYMAYREPDVGSGKMRLRAMAYKNGAWAFIDGSNGSGLNFNPAFDNGTDMNLAAAALGDKFYLVWEESNGTGQDQIRAAVYDGTSWAMIDGGGVNGLNVNPGYAAYNMNVFTDGAHVYAAWNEASSVLYQQEIRVFRYEGSGSNWTALDGGGLTGINVDPTHVAVSPLGTASGGNLYVAWSETDGTHFQARVKKYDGSAWTSIDGGGLEGLNKDPSHQDSWVQSIAVFNSKVYISWMEQDASLVYQARVARYDGGSSWTFVDGGGAEGVNYDSTRDAASNRLYPFGGYLYQAWNESTAAASQVRLARYTGGSSWIQLSAGADGLNKSPSFDAEDIRLASSSSAAFAIWDEDNGSGVQQIRAYQLK